MTYQNRSTTPIGNVYGQENLFPLTGLTTTVLEGAITAGEKAALLAWVNQIFDYFPQEFDSTGEPQTQHGHYVTFKSQDGVSGNDVGVGTSNYVAPARITKEGGAPQWYIDLDAGQQHVVNKIMGIFITMKSHVTALTTA